MLDWCFYTVWFHYFAWNLISKFQHKARIILAYIEYLKVCCIIWRIACFEFVSCLLKHRCLISVLFFFTFSLVFSTPNILFRGSLLYSTRGSRENGEIWRRDLCVVEGTWCLVLRSFLLGGLIGPIFFLFFFSAVETL